MPHKKNSRASWAKRLGEIDYVCDVDYLVSVMMKVAIPIRVPIEPIANESPGGTDHDERCFVPFGST